MQKSSVNTALILLLCKQNYYILQTKKPHHILLIYNVLIPTEAVFESIGLDWTPKSARPYLSKQQLQSYSFQVFCIVSHFFVLSLSAI